MNIIEVSGLTKYYDDFLAADHISFAVKEGVIFGFFWGRMEPGKPPP